MNTFEAKYPGICGECGHPIEVGDEVGYASDGTLVHAECEDAFEAPTKQETTCTGCWMIKPCECDD